MISKNDRCVLTVTGMSGEGFGVARYTDKDAENFVVFISSAALGDTAEVLIVKVLRNYAFAKILRIIEPSPDRTESDCPVSDKCGSCCYRHISYEKELAYKHAFVKDIFRKNYPDCPVGVLPPVPSDDTIGYRNKAQFPLSPEGKCGYYALNSHRVVPCDGCVLTDSVFEDIAAVTEQHISEYGLSVYNEETEMGLVRHLCIRKAPATGQIMIILVTTSENVPHKTQLIEKYTKIPNITSIYLNINKRPTNVIYGTENIHLWGEENITDILCGLKFEISPLSFYQVNSAACEKLYRYAAEQLKLDKNDVLLDLYCGIGTIGLSMADKVRRVYGIEIVRDAVNCACKNALLNRIENAEFFFASADETDALMANIPPEDMPNTLVVDPPRKGLDEKTLDAIIKINPEKFVYISCNPATLARDLQLLNKKGGFIPVSIQPFDMFPRTKHIETVVLMSRTI